MNLDKEKSSYLKSIGTLMSGAMVAQIFTMVCSPILTRICSPEVIGVYSLVTGAVTMFGMVMSLRYELCIVSEPDEEKVYPLVKLSILLCVVLSIIITVGYLFYFRTVSSGENFVVLAIITGALVFLMGIINIVTAYNNRQREYTLITKAYAVRVIAQNILNLVAAFCNMGAIGLSFSHLAGYMMGVRGQSVQLWKNKKTVIGTSSESVKQVAVENSKQALLSSPATLANGLSYSLINYFIEALFSTAIVGYYSISYRILGLPITIISGNVSKVFMEKASKEYQEKGNFKDTYKYTVALLTLIGIPMGIIIIIFAPWVCELLFGKGWGLAGEYVRILTPMFICRFIAGGINCSAIIVNQQQYDLFIQVLLTVFSLSMFVVAKIFKLSVESFLLSLNILFSAGYIVYIVLFWKCAKGMYKQN